MGVSIRYDAGMKPGSGNTQEINPTTFLITGGAGLAVHIEDGIADISSFQACLGTKWHQWCQRAMCAHQDAMLQTIHSCIGPWYHPDIGVYWVKLNGGIIYWHGL